MNRYEETDAVVRLEDELERIMRERDMLREALEEVVDDGLKTNMQEWRDKARAALKQLEEE